MNNDLREQVREYFNKVDPMFYVRVIDKQTATDELITLIRTATLDEVKAELLTPDYLCILGKHNVKWAIKAIDKLRGNDE